MISQELNEKLDRHTSGLSHGQRKISCPNCQDTRTKNKHDTPLSVKIDEYKVIYHCHHCNIKGVINRYQSAIKKGGVMKVVKAEKPQKKIVLADKQEEKANKWLLDRKISLETADKFRVAREKRKYLPVIGFSFYNPDGEVEAVKFRKANGDKDFWWENNAKRFWGEHEFDSNKETIEDTVVITEGEMDVLAIAEAFKDYNIAVYSVPNGSPNKITEGKVDPSEDGRFAYVWEDRDKFLDVKKVILATDQDSAGDVLTHELSRRIGKAKCYRMDYKGYKDANELLIETDEETVRKQLINAEPIPLHGLNDISFYTDEFQSLYDEGKPQGINTGYESVDKVFNLQTGLLYVVTGYAGEGKSAFIDQLVVNAGKNYNWKTCYASFEKNPSYHSVQLAQIITGKPFFKTNGHERMSQEEKDEAEAWIGEHVLFQDYLDGGLPTIENVLEKFHHSIMRNSVKICVIDPFNFIHTDRTSGLETHMISDMLSKVQLFCKQHDVLCIFIAHPQKPQDRSKKNVCNLMDISGSISWSTKADVGLTVYRGSDNVEVHCTKARWNWNAQLGKADLSFNPINGRYSEAQEETDDYDWDF